jgi:hypothetical protein
MHKHYPVGEFNALLSVPLQEVQSVIVGPLQVLQRLSHNWHTVLLPSS